MSRVLYFDCFSGISGDMALGALLDAGLPLDELKRALGSLALGDAHVHADRVLRAGVSATKFSVHEHEHDHGHDHHHHEHPPQHPAPGTPHSTNHEAAGTGHHHEHRSLPEIFRLIDESSLSPSGRERAKAMFQRLGEAEAAIHQMPVDEVHLHEVGALDSIIDIAGIAFAMEWVGADRIVCSPLNVGGGMVKSAHGVFPVPAPATVSLLGNAPIYSGAVQKELVTPTGALIATTYATAFGALPPMSIESVGYGAGDRDDPTTPNVLRVLIGRDAASPQTERVTVVECEIDDMNPQIFGVAMDRLYAAGALEVFYVAVQMKKNRPGTLLTVIVPPDKRPQIADVIFRETTTIGLRYYEVERECLQREIVSVETPLGAIRFKLARRDGRIVNATPEFDDCAKLAAANNLPVKEVQAMAIQAYGVSHS
ncbi:MAG TPA: nickel pincer cofactor biosynthesis protein LarC [Vicinamibacterales bacterium]|nr:nickel pincer cofactor biosynthesis protein LarC [Vicinamibacterales bacterium]